MAHPALQRAIDAARGQTALAQKIGTAQQNLSYWLNRAKRGVPAEWCRPIEEATGIPVHELRPDLFPPPGPTPRTETKVAA